MQFGVDGKSINVDIHCSDDKSRFNAFAHNADSAPTCLDEVHKLRDSAEDWVHKYGFGERPEQVVKKEESEKIGEFSKNAQHVFENFEHVYTHSRDQFMGFLKSQREKQEPFEQRVLDFGHEIQDIFRK